MRRIVGSVLLVFAAVAVVESCGWDASLREYLARRFWLPFSKSTVPLERRNVRRVSVPYAGMDSLDVANVNLRNLRNAYRGIADISVSFVYGSHAGSQIEVILPSLEAGRVAIRSALSDRSLSAAQREEVALIEAKIDMRQGKAQYNDPVLLNRARQKLESFVRTARNPAFASEARGWIAHIHSLLGNQAAAGKIYLAELNRDGSNLSRETLLNSLRILYGYDGGDQLRAHIDEYFDTPEHAAFAIQLVTNPRTDRTDEQIEADSKTYQTIMKLAQERRTLFDSAQRSEELTLLLMRTALRMGDPAGTLSIAETVAGNSALSSNPDLRWMKASAHFVSGDYTAAEQPLLELFQSSQASSDDKAAAAYGLVGVYMKLNDPVEQLHYALWLHSQYEEPVSAWNASDGSSVEDRTVYLAPSAWDFASLLDYQLSNEALTTFIDRYPNVPRLRLVRYAYAVRLAREDRYAESAQLYASINASIRAARMRRLAALHAATLDPASSDQQRMEAQYHFAESLVSNSGRIYFNDTLWDGFQNYALIADADVRLTKSERDAFVSGERNLRDSQEERWRAYILLNDIVEKAGRTPLGRRSALLALRSLRGIAQRFGREEEIVKADLRLSSWLR